MSNLLLWFVWWRVIDEINWGRNKKIQWRSVKGWNMFRLGCHNGKMQGSLFSQNMSGATTIG